MEKRKISTVRRKSSKCQTVGFNYKRALRNTHVGRIERLPASRLTVVNGRMKKSATRKHVCYNQVSAGCSRIKGNDSIEPSCN